MQERFIDKNYFLTDFNKEVWVKCPTCGERAVTKANYETKQARLVCPACSYNKEVSMLIEGNVYSIFAAHRYFTAELWLKAPFKNNLFWAYNNKHLEYLEDYIRATLREHKDREHFTLLEKLPRWYHDAKNRDALLKLIAKLKQTY